MWPETAQEGFSACVICHTCLTGPLMHAVGCPMSCPTCVLVFVDVRR